MIRTGADTILGELNRLCEGASISEMVVAAPYVLDEETARSVLRRPNVVGLVAEGSTEALAQEFPDSIGSLNSSNGDWILPARRFDTLVFLGSERQIGYRMARTALRAGVREILYPATFGVRWVRVRAWRQFAVALARGVIARAQQRLRGSHNLAGRLLGAAIERRYAPAFKADYANIRRSLLAPGEFSGEIVMVTGSLAGGGAERQVANTLIGLSRRSLPASLVCDRLDSGSHDFFLPTLKAAGVRATALDSTWTWQADDPVGELEERLRRSLNAVPYWVAEGLLAYAREFLRERPRVVHAWQDETNIKAGIAALAVGVPRIVLSTRSMAPVHFQLFQPFMREAYRLLARFPNVAFLNNSEAGAVDYARWLGLPPRRIKVLRNGISMDELAPPASEDVAAWRREVGLGEDGPLVGTVLRFTEEKGPLLWVRTAAVIARRRQDVRFLMIGGGPMMDEARKLAQTLGVSERILMPGMHPRPAIPLSCMDVFMLTSRLEGLPNVIIEAQALGVPVVTTDAGGSAEAIDAGRTGWAVKPHSPAALADQVLEVLGSADLRQQAREGARDFVATRFGLERMIDETVSIYERGPEHEAV